MNFSIESARHGSGR